MLFDDRGGERHDPSGQISSRHRRRFPARGEDVYPPRRGHGRRRTCRCAGAEGRGDGGRLSARAAAALSDIPLLYAPQAVRCPHGDERPQSTDRAGSVPAGTAALRPCSGSSRTTGTMSTASSRRKSTYRRSILRARTGCRRARMPSASRRALCLVTGRGVCPRGSNACQSRAAAA